MYNSHIFEKTNSWTTDSFGKRLFDISFSILMLVLFAPVILTIVIMLKFADRGPVFYSHQRIGKGGREFPCYKFRTMVLDADDRLEKLLQSDPSLRQEWQRARKLRDDPRIIPGIGHVLRKVSLDELPQIFNVMLGDMSVVGPRPVVEDELKYYGTLQKEYLSVRPGLTGPWQSSTRSDSTYVERVQMDAHYVRTGSLWNDIWIILATTRKFLGLDTRGAY
jgi:exopolysaccharide production protein ExoY